MGSSTDVRGSVTLSPTKGISEINLKPPVAPGQQKSGLSNTMPRQRLTTLDPREFHIVLILPLV